MSTDLLSYTTDITLIKAKDLTPKATALNNQLDDLLQLNRQFSKIIKGMAASEQGKIMEAIIEESENNTRSFHEIIEQTKTEITSTVRRYEEQVRDMNRQSVTFRYSDAYSNYSYR